MGWLKNRREAKERRQRNRTAKAAALGYELGSAWASDPECLSLSLTIGIDIEEIADDFAESYDQELDYVLSVDELEAFSRGFQEGYWHVFDMLVHVKKRSTPSRPSAYVETEYVRHRAMVYD